MVTENWNGDRIGTQNENSDKMVTESVGDRMVTERGRKRWKELEKVLTRFGRKKEREGQEVSREGK